MTYAEYTSYLSRRVGPAFTDLAARASIEDALDSLTPAPLPAGWGTSPRRAPKATGHAPTPAKAYKPTHGGYPSGVKA